MRFFCRLIIDDDETLFGCWTLLRHRPYVIICLRSFRQEGLHGVRYDTRELETEKALDLIRVEREQWEFSDADPDWEAVADRINGLAETYDHCFAPAPHCEENGWDPNGLPPTDYGIVHHDVIGLIALDAFGPERVTLYETYTKHGGKTLGAEVPFEHEWVELKLRALAEYRSQSRLWPSHFVDSIREYYME